MSRTVSFEFDPFELTGEELPEGAKAKDVLEDVAQYVLEETLSHVGEEKSPVAGHGAFKKLSKAYASKKRADGHPPVPNLLFTGDMLDALKTKRRGNKVIIEISGKQGDKADGHNNHSGESELPLRRFIPTEDETFKPKILDGIRRIIKARGDL